MEVCRQAKMMTKKDDCYILTLPWRVLVPDNQRHSLMQGQLKLTKHYREALLASRSLFAQQWKQRPLTDPVSIHGQLTFPDKRVRDAFRSAYHEYHTDEHHEEAFDVFADGFLLAAQTAKEFDKEDTDNGV